MEGGQCLSKSHCQGEGWVIEPGSAPFPPTPTNPEVAFQPPHILSELAPPSLRRIHSASIEIYTIANTRDRLSDSKAKQLKPEGEHYRRETTTLTADLFQSSSLHPFRPIQKETAEIASEWWGCNLTPKTSSEAQIPIAYDILQWGGALGSWHPECLGGTQPTREERHFLPQSRDPRGLDSTYWKSKEKPLLINLLKKFIIYFLQKKKKKRYTLIITQVEK